MRILYWFKYRRLLRWIKTAKIYDGRHKGIDVYECNRCGYKLYTYYKDKGVTPFTMSCPACPATMVHNATIKTVNAKTVPWVRPTFKQLCRLSPDVIKHVLDGGLVLETHLK